MTRNPSLDQTRIDIVAMRSEADSLRYQLAEKVADIREAEEHFRGLVGTVLKDGIHDALVAIFGGEPEVIQVSHLDHLCACLTSDKVETLLRGVGGAWEAVLTRIEARRADLARAKNPGVDGRLS